MSLDSIKISLDAMGGDKGPHIVVPAAALALQRHPHLHLVLVGHKEALDPLLKVHRLPMERVTLHHAAQSIGMDEAPIMALRNKKQSSMRVAINLVQQKQVHACVSAGNTGALVAISKFVLNTIAGIDRPAIISKLPTLNNHYVYMLDLGANIDSTPQQLFQFAVMGVVLTEAVENSAAPKLGLLNIGQESIKGNIQVKQTAELLMQTKAMNYVGFVEGDDIYTGAVDVILCDGFIGNVTLKASEGIAKLVLMRIKQEFNRNWFSKVCAVTALPVLKRIKNRLDPAQYNGASLLGLQGIVIKSHGNTTIAGYAQAIEEALIETTKQVPQRIGDKVANLLKDMA